MWYMKRLFTTSRHIDSPVEPVWDALADVTRWPEWTPTTTSVERLDDGVLRPGSRVRIRQPRLPQAVWTVTEMVAGRCFAWVAQGPGMSTTGRHEVVADGDGCLVTLSIEQSGPMGAVAALVWRGLTQRYIETEALSLDRRVTGAASA